MDFQKLQDRNKINNGAVIFLLLLVLNLLFGGFYNGVEAYSVPPTDEQRLVRYLTANYSRLGKPGLSHTVPLLLQVRFFPVKLQNLLEKDETLEMTIRMQLNWKDPALQFDPLQFNNQSSVILPGGSIWIPDLQISNSMSDLYGLLRDPRFDFKVYSDGTVWWHPTGNIATRCEILLAYFPFDHQRCPIVIESGIYTDKQLNLTLRYDKTAWSKSMYAESGHWDLVSIRARSRLKYVTNSTAFTTVEFWIFLGRKSGYYKLNIIFPCGMLSALQMLTFFLPLESSERVPEATTILLSVIVFQSMIIQDLPRSSDALPLLCVYIDLLTGISVISVGEAVLIAYLVSRKQDHRLCPGWAVPLLRCLYRLRNCNPVCDARSSKEGEQLALNRFDSRRRGHHTGYAPSSGGYYYQHRTLDCQPSGGSAIELADVQHCYYHRRNCIFCYEADCHRRGSVPTNDSDVMAKHRDPAKQHRRRPAFENHSTVANIAFLKAGTGDRPNGAVPAGGRSYVISNNADEYHRQETTDNRHNIQLYENFKQPRLVRSNSKMRPVLLAPLARIDNGSDVESSDYELSDTSFCGNDNQSSHSGNVAEKAAEKVVVRPQDLIVTPPTPCSQVLEEANKPKIDDGLSVDVGVAEPTTPFTSNVSSSGPKRRQKRGNAPGRDSPHSTNVTSTSNRQPAVVIDWVFLAKVVDYVAFVCCLFSITGVPVFLFGIIPPDSPDYDLDSSRF